MISDALVPLLMVTISLCVVNTRELLSREKCEAGFNSISQRSSVKFRFPRRIVAPCFMAYMSCSQKVTSHLSLHNCPTDNSEALSRSSYMCIHATVVEIPEIGKEPASVEVITSLLGSVTVSPGAYCLSSKRWASSV